MAKRQETEPWYAAGSGVRIGRYSDDDSAAEVIALALDNGWSVLSHNVVWVPSGGVFFLFLFGFSARTEHVITFTKASA